MRRVARIIATTFFTGFVLTILAAITAEFFIEWVRENGWYANPSQRVDALVGAFRYYTTQVWFVAATAFATGLTIGLWFDLFVRQIEIKRDKNEEMIQKQTLLELYDAVEAAKKMLLNDLNNVSHDAFHEVSYISVKLARLGVDTPFHVQYTNKFTYEEFGRISYRYLSSISAYVREGALNEVRYWAKSCLTDLKGIDSASKPPE